jgi:hypothetical protein
MARHRPDARELSGRDQSSVLLEDCLDRTGWPPFGGLPMRGIPSTLFKKKRFGPASRPLEYRTYRVTGLTDPIIRFCLLPAR